MCARLTLAIMTYAPLCGGMLTGKYKRGTTSAPDTRSQEDKKLQKLLANDQAFDVIDALRPIAREEGVELPQLAVLWLLAKPYVTTPILGGSKAEHFRTMYTIADHRLSDETVVAHGRAVSRLRIPQIRESADQRRGAFVAGACFHGITTWQMSRRGRRRAEF